MEDRWNLRDPDGSCKLCRAAAGHGPGCGGALLEQVKIRATFTVPDEDTGPHELFEEGRDERSLGAELGATLEGYRVTQSPPELSLQLSSKDPQFLALFDSGEIERTTEKARRLGASAREAEKRVREEMDQYERDYAAKESGRRAEWSRISEEMKAIDRTLRISGLTAEAFVTLDAKRVELGEMRNTLNHPTPYSRKPFEDRIRAIIADLAAALKALKGD